MFRSVKTSKLAQNGTDRWEFESERSCLKKQVDEKGFEPSASSSLRTSKKIK